MTYESMIVETIKINGHNSDAINAYTARPMGKGPFSRGRVNTSFTWLG